MNTNHNIKIKIDNLDFKKDEDPTIYNSDDCKTYGDLVIKRERLALQGSMKYAYQRAGLTPILYPEPSPNMSIKDDISLMSIATYALGKKGNTNKDKLVYKLKDGEITIRCHPDFGMATDYDYDLVMFMISHLTKQMNLLKRKVEQENIKVHSNPKFTTHTVNYTLPSRSFTFKLNTFLKFAQRTKGGNQYKAITDTLDRLTFTKIKIESYPKQSLLRRGMFSFIGDYKVISDDKNKEGILISIDIPRWIYDGIVRIEQPTVLTVNKKYFKLKEGINKFLYRYGKRLVGKREKVKISVKEIHERSGSINELKYFTRDLKQVIKKLTKDPFEEFYIDFITEGRGQNYLVFKKNQENTKQTSKLTKSPIVLTEEIEQKAREIAPSFCPKWLFEQFVSYNNKRGWKNLRNPRSAFIGFCRKHEERKHQVIQQVSCW